MSMSRNLSRHRGNMLRSNTSANSTMSSMVSSSSRRILPCVGMAVQQVQRTAPFTTSAHLRKSDSASNAQQQARSISTNAPKEQASPVQGSSSAAARPEPSPSFQQTPPSNKIARNQQQEELDESFVGMSGGQIFHEMMLRHGVRHIFGYPGGAILPVFDAIYNSKNFDFILPRREDGAGHMAQAYSRVTGKPGVVLVTSGPGATNTVTPLADAQMDGSPLIVFCGQVATSAIGSDAFQEADMLGISRSCTKWNVMVKNITELPRRINEAFKIAMSGRPGPVLVDLPKDVTAGILWQALPFSQTTPNQAALPSRATARPRSRLLSPSSNSSVELAPEIRQAADLINKAKRPIIYAGQGMLSSPEGPELLKTLSHRGQIPVTTTLQGLGAFDENDPLSLHMLGMHGSAYANLAMQDADLIIALGARFDDRVTGRVDKFAPHARAAAMEGRGGIIHYEIMPKNINKVVQATCAIEGDVVRNLGKTLPLIKENKTRGEWIKKLDEWKTKYPFYYNPAAPDAPAKPQEVMEEIDIAVGPDRKKDLVVSTGVGAHQMWAAQHIRWTTPRTWVTSGGAGTMGVGIPFAIGAKVAQPEKIVIDVDGDASAQMTFMEMATASEFGVGVKVLILNNNGQGMVVQWQDLFYEERYSHTKQKNPSFTKLAEACGIKGILCKNKGELKEKMAEFINYDNTKPVLMEVLVEDKEHVLPMVAAGKALHEMVLHADLKLESR